MPSTVSVQLFSVRDQLASDRDGTLRRLVAAGVEAVEPFGFEEDAAEQSAAIASAGLRIPSVHASLFSGDPEPLLAAAAEAGVKTVIDPFSTAENWVDRDAVAAFAERFAPVVDAARRHGIRVGYHNHDAELRSRIDGRPALELFAELLHPDAVLQIDTYWSQAGGVPAVPLLERLGERVASLHLKDGDGRVDAHTQVALGRGAQPLPEILAAAPRAERVIELDDVAGDVFEAIAASVAWLGEHDR